ncbi:MAG: phosphomannomutase/phosphoglucomutase [Candidatus Blackburnbacteria bacterium]|nr:phosphomannomutase/phosphoglucomutase [Candidatus Blackburnbacteria bacterium]
MVPTVSAEIFHAYDIRGVYPALINEDVFFALGQAFGTYVICHGSANLSKNNIAVGRDNRSSGESLMKSFIGGLISTGCTVTDLGIVITPMVNFSEYTWKVSAGVSITASHNRPEFNGLKISFNKKPFSVKDYQELEKIIKIGKFEEDKGKPKKEDVWPRYKEQILQLVKVPQKLKIVIDSGNGTTGLFAPDLFRSLGCEVVELFTKSDGSFPNHLPYPQLTENYKKLSNSIKENKADFGLAFDGDGDRLGVYDEKGFFVQDDLLGAIFAASILEKKQGENIVVNIGTSSAAITYLERHGGKAVYSKTGYPFVMNTMQKVNSPFGAELSGHFYFKDEYFGFGDAMYAAARFCQIIAEKGVTVSQLMHAFPKVYATEEVRLDVPRDIDKDKLIEKVKDEIVQRHPDAKINLTDGVWFTLPNGSWGSLRSSNTENVLSVRAEAKSSGELKKVVSLVEELLGSQGVTFNWKQV